MTTINPIVDEKAKYMVESRLAPTDGAIVKSGVLDVRHVEVKVYWDERTTITVDVSEPVDFAPASSPVERMRLMEKRARRVAECIALLPTLLGLENLESAE